jgi:two-component system, LytTR family, response regulator LytT
MSKLRIGIVEDEAIIADSMAETLLKLGYEVAEPAASYAEAIQMIEDEKPDLLLLDIQLKGKKDGIDLAAKIKETYRLPVIFITANADSATIERAKKVNPANYLTKPFTKGDLYIAIEICLHNYHEAKPTKPVQANSKPLNGNYLFIKDGQLYNKVKIDDIIYLQSKHVYIHIHTLDKIFLVRSSLNDYLGHLDTGIFFRVHRSYVINLNHLQSINAEYVIINGVTLPVGKTYRDQLLKKLNLE